MNAMCVSGRGLVLVVVLGFLHAMAFPARAGSDGADAENPTGGIDTVKATARYSRNAVVALGDRAVFLGWGEGTPPARGKEFEVWFQMTNAGRSWLFPEVRKAHVFRADPKQNWVKSLSDPAFTLVDITVEKRVQTRKDTAPETYIARLRAPATPGTYQVQFQNMRVNGAILARTPRLAITVP